MKASFKPPFGLGNGHIQTMLSSAGPRTWLENKRARDFQEASTMELVTTPGNVRLEAKITRQVSDRLAIMIHGWEGHADSIYILNTGRLLWEKGFNVVRLNLRDHGTSHALNSELFRSTLITEVVEAVEEIIAYIGVKHNTLTGFSLGGNFALRVANMMSKPKAKLDAVATVCPLLHPPTTMKALNDGLSVYQHYFIGKWKRSLQKKLQFFPELGYGERLKKLKTLTAMNDYFIKHFTPYQTTNEYLNDYSVLGDRLADISMPTKILTSIDDPIIGPEELKLLSPNDNIDITLTPKGGHCAYLQDYKLTSWASEYVADWLFQQTTQSRIS